MKRKIVRLQILAFCFLCIISCDLYKYDEGWFSDKPQNMVDFNTEFDDYNSALPPSLGGVVPFLFSSNRNSHGKNYDITKELIDVNFDRKNGELSLTNKPYEGLDIVRGYVDLVQIPNLVNTENNELGPYIIEKNYYTYQKFNSQFVFLYANDTNGDFDIYFTQKSINDSNFKTPQKVRPLNTNFNDAYPSITNQLDELYFSSDREGKFNIYKVDIDKDLLTFLEDTVSHTISKDTILSSDYDDKCPYIKDSMLVFTSNRPGGFGGYDLYYSKRVGNSWSQPINFGKNINTEYDEYRPIIFMFMDFRNDLMIFSSNRIDGKGGYDLYYVGIEKK
jgi:hypothetical protein